ncbi:outer membrane lipoprotein carrier protein LolA [Agarivorans sp. QJM3NY_33]|uniref:outer membrane lipoprotein carrier protein LolA n=1 Tax=Agarivorans sp. QJM3NY_33 TaxID=3421432 RepID=UPI003D7C4FE1
MHRLIGYLLALCCISSLAYGETLENIQHALAKQSLVTGHFEQTRNIPALSRPLKSSGQFYIVKNRALLWDQQQPFAQQSLLTESAIYQGQNGQLSQRDTGSAQMSQYFSQLLVDIFSGDFTGLSEQFDIEQTATTTANWQLNLSPQQAPLKQIFSQISLRGKQGVVEHIRLVEQRGDQTDIVLRMATPALPLPTFLKQVLVSD